MKLLREQLTDIENRNKEIDGLIASEKDLGKIETLRKEKEDNLVKRGELNIQIANEDAETKRKADEALKNAPETRKDNPKMNLTARSARNLWLGKVFRNAVTPTPFTEEERAAIQSALTTTSTTYVAPTDSATGTNNGGVFIPSNILTDLLNEDSPLTPIMNDVVMTAVPGLMLFPYRKSRSVASAKKEGSGTTSAAIEWGTVQGKTGFLQLVVTVTDEVLALTPMALGEYLSSQIVDDLREDWSTEVIYGSGKADANGTNHIEGITVSAIAKTYTAGMELDGVITGLKAVPKKFCNGAKIYLAHDMYLSLVTTKDTTGRPILESAISANAALNGLFGYVAQEDSTLNDGEFIIGNVKRRYKLNQLSPLTTEPDRHPLEHTTDIIASVFCAGAAVPNAFVYGKVGA